MDELGVVFQSAAYQEDADELQRKLVDSNHELELVHRKLTETQENVTNLLNMLEVVYKETDEAKQQLKKISEMNNSIRLPNDVLQPVSPPILMLTTTKETLSLTESNSPCSVGSLVMNHAVAPPELPFTNMLDSNTMDSFAYVKHANVSPQLNVDNTSVTMSAQNYLASQIIDDFTKGKTLPQPGKLMQAVKEAGPLLQTLLIAGAPLPRWKNPPPPLRHPFKIPPVVPINSCTVPSPPSSDQKAFSFSNPTTSRYFNVAQTSSAANAMLSAFNNDIPSAGVSCFNSSRMMETSNLGFEHQISSAKRLRLQ